MQRDRCPVTSLSRLLIGQDVDLTSRHSLLIGPEITLRTLGVLFNLSNRIWISVPESMAVFYSLVAFQKKYQQ